MAKRKKKAQTIPPTTAKVVTKETKKPILETLKEGGLILVSAIAAGGAGAAIGKHSLLIGIPVALWGIHKGNKYITSAGLGLCLSNGFQKQSTTVGDLPDEVDGLDIAQIKKRVGNYFKGFSEKLYIPQSLEQAQETAPQTTNGLGADESPTFFTNPYNTNTNKPIRSNKLDMSQLDTLQEQIAKMAGIGNIQREF